MAHPNQSKTRAKRGGRNSKNRSLNQNRSQNSRSNERSDRTPREDHRDWEPVERGRDIRKKNLSSPTLLQKVLSLLTFGFWNKNKATKSLVRTGKLADPKTPGRPDAASRESRESRPPRERVVTAPDPDAVSGPRLHVGNLAYEAAETDLTELFKGAGQVHSAEVVYHRDTQRSKGFAFVQMLTVEEAKRAVSELHGKEFMGRRLEIGPARSTGERFSRSQS